MQDKISPTSHLYVWKAINAVLGVISSAQNNLHQLIPDVRLRSFLKKLMIGWCIWMGGILLGYCAGFVF